MSGACNSCGRESLFHDEHAGGYGIRTCEQLGGRSRRGVGGRLQPGQCIAMTPAHDSQSCEGVEKCEGGERCECEGGER